ncbi:polysaccharide biosynthesis C-terminal domain-containing protein [Synergistaceae bacterium OttesenSCG-928-D05]|nr:polysaccharide biosynthesis C-terminal domain-containing protein [Synergistaceae bacterium OttesenSCG-928-D05]
MKKAKIMLTTKIKNLFSFLLGKHNARNATIITTGLSLFSRVFGYARTLLIAYLFGATAFVDAYYVALGAVSFIPGILSSTIETAILPNMIQSNEDDARNLFGLIFRALAIFTVLLAAILLTFPEPYIRVFARTFDSTRIAYASGMVKWLLPLAISTLAIALFSAWANYKNCFAVPNTIMAFANILLIPILLILYTLIGDTALPAFQGLGFALLVLVMWYTLRDAPLQPKKPLPPELIRKVSGEVLLRILASGATFLYVLIDRYFASSLPTGNVAAISYANLLFAQPTGLTAAAFSIFFVRANERIALSEDSKELLFTTLFMAASYFLPMAILLSILSRPIIVILLGHGAFDTQAVALTYPCLAILALGLPVFIWNIFINKHAIAMGRLKIIAIWGYIGVCGNLFLDWLFVKPYGAPGLCAATIIMWHVSTICLMLFFCKETLWHLLKSLLPQILVITLWAIPLCYALQNMNILLSLAMGAGIGVVHFLLCEITGLFRFIPSKWRPVAITLLLINKLCTRNRAYK